MSPITETATQYVLGQGTQPTTLLTNSSISTYMECPRKYQLAYVEGLRPEREADYFRIGGAFHKGQEVLGKTGDLEQALTAIADNYKNPPQWVQMYEDRVEAWYFEAVTCMCLLRGHWEYWGGRMHEKPPESVEIAEVIETEQVFKVAIRDPKTGHATPRFRRGGKIDKIVRLKDGRIAMKEYKTAGQDIMPGSDYWWRLKIDSQVSGYYAAGIEKAIPIDTNLYDVTRKPSIRPSQVPVLDADGYKWVVLVETGKRVKTVKGDRWKQSVTDSQTEKLLTRKMEPEEWDQKLMAHIRAHPTFYYQRDEVVRTDKDIQDYTEDLWGQQKMIAESQRTGRWPKNTRACISRTTCVFFGLCTGRVSVEDGEVPVGFRRSVSVHEELETD